MIQRNWNYFTNFFIQQTFPLILSLLAIQSTAKVLQRHTREAIEHSVNTRQTNKPWTGEQHFCNLATNNWDDTNTFFSPEFDQIRATYKSNDITPCPWQYTAEHDFNRYPQYVQNVSCLQSSCHNIPGILCECREVGYTVPILKRTQCGTDKQEWMTANIIVNVACVPRFFSHWMTFLFLL